MKFENEDFVFGVDRYRHNIQHRARRIPVEALLPFNAPAGVSSFAAGR